MIDFYIHQEQTKITGKVVLRMDVRGEMSSAEARLHDNPGAELFRRCLRNLASRLLGTVLDDLRSEDPIRREEVIRRLEEGEFLRNLVPVGMISLRL